MFTVATSRLRPSAFLPSPGLGRPAAFLAAALVSAALAGPADVQAQTAAPVPAPNAQALQKPATGGKAAPEPLVTFPGGVVWQSVLPAAPAYAPAFDPTRAYVALKDDTLVAVTADTGAINWTVPQASTSAPSAAGGLVVGASGTDIWARDSASGALKWQQTVGAATLSPVSAGPLGILAITSAGGLACLDPVTGAVRWRRDLGVSPSAHPTVLDTRVFVGLSDGRVVAVNAATGAPIWTRTLGGAVLTLSSKEKFVVAGSDDNFLYVLDAKNGNPKWSWRTGGDVIGEAVLDAHRLYYVSLDNVLRAHNRGNGHLVWQRRLTSRPSGGPLWIGDRVVVGGVQPELHAFMLADGSPAGVTGIPGRVIHRPYLVDASDDLPSRLVIVTGSGQMQAIGQTIEPELAPLAVLPGVLLAPEVLPKAPITK